MTDRKTIDAVIMKLAVIGEAVKYIPASVQDSYPDIPWRKMQGLRNVLIHEYDRISLDVIWYVIQSDLPPLISPLTAIYERATDDE
ncbi:MAG: HepT-like ribonuclease domain-containing protein [bacterium]